MSKKLTKEEELYRAKWHRDMLEQKEKWRKENGLPRGCGALLHPIFCGCPLEQKGKE